MSLALSEPTKLRSGDLNDLVTLLKEQADIRYDVVVSADNLSYRDGNLVVKGGAARFTDDGMESADAVLRPTGVCEDHIAGRFDIPARYLRRLRADALITPDPEFVLDRPSFLLDDTVNAHLAHEPGRKFLVRGFRTDDPDAEGIARAVLSDRYGAIDNLDVLLAALDGVKQAGVDVQIDGCDLSERNMQVRVSAPQITALAPVWLRNYRSPFDEDRDGGALQRWRGVAAREGQGYTPGEEPIVWAGFKIKNSETGGGAYTLAPHITAKVCKNGLTISTDALRAVHIGGKLDEGVIEWSADTGRKAIDLITAKTRDAVATFLNEDYLAKIIERIEEKSSTPIGEPAKVLERVTQKFAFSQGESDTILAAFISSGDPTAGGVLNAVTALAQTIEDPDRAAEVEASALDVLDFVAA